MSGDSSVIHIRLLRESLFSDALQSVLMRFITMNPLSHSAVQDGRVSTRSMIARKVECHFPHLHRLVGLVVKASASRAGGPWFESR